MAIITRQSNGRGSLRDMQILVNQYPGLLNSKIAIALGNNGLVNIEWQSPLIGDEFSEYSDQDFLTRLGVNGNLNVQLDEFWPPRGPVWDGLGRVNNQEAFFLVEAKANIPEIVTSPTGAARGTLELINQSLQSTKEYLGINNQVDWSGTFYQYTNRIAHLYFLRALNELPAYLIFIYFMNDRTVQHSPTSKKEWQAAILVMKRYLKIRQNHGLSQYIAEIFIDVENWR
jgi:hypothetical protein